MRAGSWRREQSTRPRGRTVARAPSSRPPGASTAASRDTGPLTCGTPGPSRAGHHIPPARDLPAAPRAVCPAPLTWGVQVHARGLPGTPGARASELPSSRARTGHLQVRALAASSRPPTRARTRRPPGPDIRIPRVRDPRCPSAVCPAPLTRGVRPHARGPPGTPHAGFRSVTPDPGPSRGIPASHARTRRPPTRGPAGLPRADPPVSHARTRRTARAADPPVARAGCPGLNARDVPFTRAQTRPPARRVQSAPPGSHPGAAPLAGAPRAPPVPGTAHTPPRAPGSRCGRSP